MQPQWKIDPTNELGRGAFSVVFGGSFTVNTKQVNVAIKVIEYNKMQPLAQRYMDREVEVMKMLNHPNLVHLHHSEVFFKIPNFSPAEKKWISISRFRIVGLRIKNLHSN